MFGELPRCQGLLQPGRKVPWFCLTFENGWERGILCNKTMYHMYMFFILFLLFYLFLSHCKWVLLFFMCFYHLVELRVGMM